MIRRRSASVSPSPSPAPSPSTSRSPSSSPCLTPNASRRPTILLSAADGSTLTPIPVPLSNSTSLNTTPTSLITRIFKKKPGSGSDSSSPPLQPVIGTPRELPARARALTHDDIHIDIDINMTTVAPINISENTRARSRSASIVTSTLTIAAASTSTSTLASSAWNVSSISGSLSASASPSISSRSLNRISSHVHHERTRSSHHALPTSEQFQAPPHPSHTHTRTRSQTISPNPAEILYHDIDNETCDDGSEPAASSRTHPLIRPRSASLRTVAAAPVPTSRHPFTVSPTLPGTSWEQKKSSDINKKDAYGHEREKDSEESLLAQDPDVPPLML